jgi:hypothetical protein
MWQRARHPSLPPQSPDARLKASVENFPVRHDKTPLIILAPIFNMAL